MLVENAEPCIFCGATENRVYSQAVCDSTCEECGNFQSIELGREIVASSLPSAMIEELSAGQDVTETVAAWSQRACVTLENVADGRKHLENLGIDDVTEMDEETVIQYVLWTVCCEISERQTMGEDDVCVELSVH